MTRPSFPFPCAGRGPVAAPLETRREDPPRSSPNWAPACAGAPVRTASILIALALAACSGLSREARIEAKLEQAGVKPHLARCLAHKFDEKLSDDELARLGDAAKAARTAGDGDRHLSIGALADRLQSPDDQHLADTVSRAALGCAILG